ncbi:hypothetical protein LCGC14_0657410 [marine sediment metagenome]|uniref:4Fe4S-binding SPASM domain-containing protein n=1 Tax=marine sediment metagenome TaxID=412755 RepID=A0A0F9U2Y0_9ZZZZ
MSQALRLQLQTTTLCTAKCLICPHRNSPVLLHGGVMTDDIYSRVLAAAAGIRFRKIACYMQGEPLTDPQLAERLEELSKRLTFDLLELSTNGSLLTSARSARLVSALQTMPSHVTLSFFGTNKQDYERITGLPFEQTLAHVYEFLKLTDHTHIGRSIVALGDEVQVRDFWHQQTAKLRRVPRLKLLRVNNRAGYGSGAKAVNQPPSRFLRCCRIQQWIHVSWRGDIILCCNDYKHAVVFGNVKNNTDLVKLQQQIPACCRQLATAGSLPCYRCDMKSIGQGAS